MRKTTAVLLALVLMSFISLSSFRPALAGISGTPTWLVPAWESYNDPLVGHVDVGYVNGSTWMLNIWVYDGEVNGTGDPLDATVKNINVWFDWNKNYSTPINPAITVKYGHSYLFTATGTTEMATESANLYTHSYIVYVEYEVSYLSGGVGVTVKKTWMYDNDQFAVIAPDQYDAETSHRYYSDLKSRLGSFADTYAQSEALFVQAETEASAGAISYGQAAFTDAKTHYDSAASLLNQSWTTFISIETVYDNIHLNSTKADLDMQLAQIQAVQANATAQLIQANGFANAVMINSVGFVFFGLGFIFIGIATIFYARRPKPA